MLWIMQNDSALVVRAAELVGRAKHLVAFTGAGISAGSGIPTYRGEGGMWTRMDPEKVASIDYFDRDPSYYWRFFQEVRFATLAEARPNNAHLALADLERRGLLRTIITQNIDGLHQQAGSRSVLELHGNTRRFFCRRCHEPFDLDAIHKMLERSLPPPCPACGGVIRPDVVFFGEMLPEAVLRESLDSARSADVMLVVGSSLVVHPAASLPIITMEHGGHVIIVSKGETAMDRVASIKIDDDAARVLPGIVAALPPEPPDPGEPLVARDQPAG